MPVTFIGVRHHSPACARLVADTIDELRPAYVLIEGPADLNERIGELLLGHQLPVAVFTSYRDDERRHGSWAPFCDYSPEWVALTRGRAVGAELRFIDLPAWHPAFAGRSNRYADAELRYADVMERLCRGFGVDNVDALWDHLFEIAPTDGLAERLATYFDLVRGEAAAGESDTAREAYMASWVRAAAASAGDRPVVVVTGGFHRPALVTLAATGDTEWPAAPRLPEGALGGSYLVPYSFRRLDAFDGYQSGMPSPGYYQELWESGPSAAARHLVTSVAGRLRNRKQPVSTADLIAARATADGLAMVRGHASPARADVLDGLASALVNEALDVPLPWSSRGTLRAGSHPVVVEMVAALSGNRVGRLHPGTPAPPLVHDLDAELARAGLDGAGDLDLDLTRPGDRSRSVILHRVRVLGVPGFSRTAGPSVGLDPALRERWALRPDPGRLTAVIEAGAHGATLADACAAALAERAVLAGRDVDALAAVLFDAALAGVTEVSDRALADIDAGVAAAPDLSPVGRMLAVVLTMWRHDRVFGTIHSAVLGRVVTAAVRRILWLAEGAHGGAAPADLGRIAALAACRDALRHAGRALSLDLHGAVETASRVSADPAAPPDLRGAAFGLRWALADLVTSALPASGPGSGVTGAAVPDPFEPVGVDAVRAVRGAFVAATAGDWLAGLFAVAREEVLHDEEVVALLDDLLSGMGTEDFLVALPALRQAFEFFPPRERETIAGRLLARRGLGGTGRSLLRSAVDPSVVAAGMRLDERVDELLSSVGLVTGTGIAGLVRGVAIVGVEGAGLSTETEGRA
ncbi:DUF5682 family protein [Actinoplanes sp. NBRC 103695]|uniref:DUF5682 family protein n=1 Tax=Actinoplanes sp. NBRC 103695 TaxID=3032202 RepID=UPI0024A22C03|nr:DUF5682 family protein [Actinoplanes sp. NBRC 103695]GLY92804.1 hypothetical protein Acsp02_00600 [Actinoplanes sp. NBRC 103695]